MTGLRGSTTGREDGSDGAKSIAPTSGTPSRARTPRRPDGRGRTSARWWFLQSSRSLRRQRRANDRLYQGLLEFPLYRIVREPGLQGIDALLLRHRHGKLLGSSTTRVSSGNDSEVLGGFHPSRNPGPPSVGSICGRSSPRRACRPWRSAGRRSPSAGPTARSSTHRGSTREMYGTEAPEQLGPGRAVGGHSS